MLNAINNLKLSFKLPIAFAGIALSSVLVMGSIGLTVASSALVEATTDKLSTIASSRASALKNYLHDIEDDLRLFSTNPQTGVAVGQFIEAYEALGSKAEQSLQKAYITDNKNPTGEKHKLDKAATNTGYDEVHAQYHPIFRELLTTKGYYDVFLFSPSGELVYSVFKEADFATNFAPNGGQWASSDLGSAFRAGLKLKPRQIMFLDFAPYAPSNDAPAAFMSAPIYSENKLVGVAAVQMPIGKINA